MPPPPKLIFPSQEIPEPQKEAFLWDLGKATKRGTKKCPDCGFINGIRSYACKNTMCNRILKATDKHKVGLQIDAIKLVSGTTRQIYSVRVREKAGVDPEHPDQRGFVQLPCAIYEKREKLSEVALCFVNHCERSYSILKCHENEEEEEDDDESENEAIKNDKNLNFCAHIEAAVKSLSVAHALEFKHYLINNLKVCDEVKKKLCSLAKSTEGPLVQRIAKNVMAIKGFVNSANPLGYLHFILEFRKNSMNEEEINEFRCECNLEKKKCLHFYACVCAFASDAKLLHKYSSFVQREFDIFISYDLNTLLEEGKDNPYPLENIKIEILRPDLLGLPHLKKKGKNKLQKVSGRSKAAKKVKTNDVVTINTSEPIRILSNEIIKLSHTVSIEQNANGQGENVQTQEMLGYDEWLCSVVERINYNSQTNHNPVFFAENILDELMQSTIASVCEVKLEFHIPEKFFTKFQCQLYFHTRNYQNTIPNDCRDVGDICGSEFCAIDVRTMHFAINNVAQLEQIFSSTNRNIQLETYHLQVDAQWPFRISWRTSSYKLSKFGELQLTFMKRNCNN